MFDPYHKWLGIPKDKRPPTHYQLLGVSPDEQDLEVINEAAIRQTTHVRAYQMGAHAADCTRILGEIAKARLTLLNPAKRKDYDQQLAKVGKPSTKADAEPAHGEVTEIASLEVAEKIQVNRTIQELADEEQQDDWIEVKRKSRGGDKDDHSRKKAAAGIGLLIGLGVGAGAVGLLLILAVGAFFLLGRSDAQPKNGGGAIAQNDAKDGKKNDAIHAGKDKKIGGKDQIDNKLIDPPVIAKGNGPIIDIPVAIPQFNAAPPEIVYQLPGNVERACLCADGRRIAMSSTQPGVFLYRQGPGLKGAQFQANIDGAESIVEPLASSLDSTLMAFAGRDKEGFKIFLWNWGDRRVESTFRTMYKAHAAVFSPDGSYLAAHSLSQTDKPPQYWVDVYHVKTGKMQTRLLLRGERPFVAFMPDSNTIFAAPFGPDQLMNSWIMPGNAPGQIQFPQPTAAHFFSPDFTRYAYIANPRQLKFGFTAGVREMGNFNTDKENVHIHTAAFSPDNQLLVVGVQDVSRLPEELGSFSLVDAKNGNVISTGPPLQFMPKQIQLASNGLCLVHEAKRPAVLYRFGPAGNVAKVEPRLPNIDGFVPLFNGKDLTGWQAHPGQPTKWGVADGILTAKPGNGGFLYSTRSDFGNFHLRAEVRRKPGGSGGVAFRYTLDFQGYEVGIAEQPPGLVDVRTVDPVEKGNGRNIRPVSSRILQPAGEWYTLEIIAFGNQISVVINGKLAAKSIDANNAFSSGRIGLRDNNQTMEFRKIDIKELSSPPPPPVVASGPFVPLFNGKDLTGWTAIRDAGTWRVTDGILTGTAKPGAGICTTRNDFSDFHLRMETRINNGGTAFVHFRSSLDPALPPGNVTNYMAHICGNNTVPFQTGSLSVHNGKGVRNLFQKERLAPPGEWFTHEIIAKGNLITVKVNGQVTKAYGGDDQINSGRISLFNTAKDSIVEFRKIEIQETVKPAGTQFVNRGSGKGLGVLAESKNDGAPIVQWQAIQTAANQYWKLVPVDKEWFNIVNVGSGTCMSALGNPAKNARIGIWQRKDGDPTQEWKLVPSDANDAAWVKIVSRVDGRVLSAIGADDKDGAPVVLIPDVNAAHQLWKVNGLDFLKVVAAKKKDEPAPLAMHVPVPNAEKIAAAEMLMREQFSKEFSKKTLADYLALADRLHKLAKETADPAERYVLLREVRDLAVKAGKTELALKAAEDLIERYDVEEWPTRLETLLVLSKTKLDTEASKQFVDIALTQAAHARAKDQFDIAGKCLNVAETVVRRIGNAVLLGQVLKQEKLNSEFAKEHAEMKAAQEKLQGDAKDPEANLVVGSYWAFRKGDWQTGLPLLALSNNSEIQEAAKKDLAAPDDDKTRVELGEAWWNLAEKKPAQQKSAMQWRAAYWYRQAVPTLTGLPLSKASGRVKQVEEQPAPFKDITGVSEVERFKGHAGAIHRLALAADGKRVFSSGQDGTIREWNLTTGKAKMLLGAQFTKAPVVDFAISPDERSIAYLNHLGKLSVYDSGAAKQPKTKRERDAVPGIYWHATNSAISYTHFQEWSTMAPNSTSSGATFPFSKDELRGNAAALVVAPELDFAAILIQGGGINICRFSNSGGGRQFAGSVSVNASAAAFSKDAKYLVVGGKSGTLYRYDVQGLKAAEAKSLTTYKGHKGPIRGIVLTSDGKRIVSAADDRTARIWDTATGQEVQRLPHLAAVTSLVITRDDRYFVTACADGIVRMWKMPTEKASQP